MASTLVPQVHFYRNQRNKDQAVFKGYNYGLDTITQRGTKRLWRCQIDGCPGRLHTMGCTAVFTIAHSHRPMPGLREKLVQWKEIKSKDLKSKQKLNSQQQQSMINNLKVRADLLYSSVTQTQMDQWPEVVDVLQTLMDRIVQHLTTGRISCTQIIPVDSSTTMSHLLTLHDVVTNAERWSEATDMTENQMTEPVQPEVLIQPCSVVIDKLNDTEVHSTLSKGSSGLVSVADIKQEVMDVDIENQISTEYQNKSKGVGQPAVMTKAMKNEQYNDEFLIEHAEASEERKYSIDRNYLEDAEDNQDGATDKEVHDESEGSENKILEDQSKTLMYAASTDVSNNEAEVDKDNVSDDDWKPGGASKRKSKTPRRRRATRQSTIEFSSDEEEYWPSAFKKITPRRNRFLVAEKYEIYDFNAQLSDDVNRRCFLCPEDTNIEITSFEGFIKHLTDANHIEYKRTTSIRLLRCPICGVDVRNRTSDRDGPEKKQILRLAGKVLQHMENLHGFDTEDTFMFKYSCEKCTFSSFGVGSFIEHLIQVHSKETGNRLEPAAAKANGAISLDMYETYDLDKPFREGIDSSCPFCCNDTPYKSVSLADFVGHLKEHKHITSEDDTSHTLSCNHCQLQFKRDIIAGTVTVETNILRLVGEAVSHMKAKHGYEPSEGFVPKYQCDWCIKRMYDCADFLEHCILVHGAREQHPKRTSKIVRNRVTDDLLKKYLPHDFGAPFGEAVDSFCPLCTKPKPFVHKATSLKDFLKHIIDSEHLVHAGGPLYTISCPNCDHIEKCRIYQMSDIQILRVVGYIVQHLVNKHKVEISPAFVPPYRCDQCQNASFSYINFMDHLRQVHKVPAENLDDVDEDQSDEGGTGFSKLPEKNVNMNASFPSEVDTSCPFCVSCVPYRAHTMSDFIQHVYRAEHLIVNRNCRYIQCHRCNEKLKCRVFCSSGNKSMQTLRVIGKAAHHLYEVHGARFEEGFLPVFDCSKCAYNTYSGEQLIEHYRGIHNKIEKKVYRPRLPAPAPVVIQQANTEQDQPKEHPISKALADMCNLHLCNDIYKKPGKTTLNFEEELKQAENTNCPLCIEPVTFTNLEEFSKHCASKHVQNDLSFSLLDCPECKTTLACKKFNKDVPITLAFSVVGKWTEHRVKKHAWKPPHFLPKFRCPSCQSFTTYNPRACHGHMYTPGKCKTNATERRKVMQPCPCCGKMVSQRSYSMHVQICSKPDSERKRTKCPICGKLFLDELSYHKSNLKHHIDIVHSDYYPHLCSICSTQFKRRNDLNRHMFMVHDINISKNIPQYCDKCDYKTLMVSHLRRHYVKHNESSQVTCHFCGKQYRSEIHLKRHLEDVHDRGSQKQYHCPQCSYVTKSKRYLQKHERWHDTSKLGAGHWCTICNYNARFPSVLKFHMKNVHKINMDEPGSEKLASFKSVVMKRRYKNMKLPGEQGAVKMSISTFKQLSSGKTSNTREDRLVSENRGGDLPLQSPSSIEDDPISMSADMEPMVSTPVYGDDCSHPSYSPRDLSTCSALTSTTMTVPTTSDVPSLTHHQQPQPQHLPSHGVDSGHHQNLVPAHRPLLGQVPSSVTAPSLLNAAQQGGDYMYNPQLFGGFMSPQGLPPQYY